MFSGGKLEYRKGQDIVVEAFRRFQAKHTDAMLVTAWHNHWPQTMAGIDAAGYVRGTPAVRDGRCEVTEWLVANGVRADAILDLGLQPQALIAQALREMHVAVFPNRCEGGTNLVAMEAMACGVPAILSANTGHLNLIGRDTCFPLFAAAAGDGAHAAVSRHGGLGRVGPRRDRVAARTRVPRPGGSASSRRRGCGAARAALVGHAGERAAAHARD